jgi:hypothetical protein
MFLMGPTENHRFCVMNHINSCGMRVHRGKFSGPAWTAALYIRIYTAVWLIIQANKSGFFKATVKEAFYQI